MPRTTATMIALGSLLISGHARAADPPPKQIDIAPIKDSLRVYHDRKGHYIILPPWDKKYRASEHTFYGDGKTFYLQPVRSASRATADRSFSVAIRDPRVQRGVESYFDSRGGKAYYQCMDRKVPFFELAPDKARSMLDKARFHQIFWRRVPHALARDDYGHYYYVDRLRGRTPSGGLRGFRVFRGLQGKMKRLRMKNVVSDERGEIFITNRGQLRLVFDKPGAGKDATATWIRRRRRTGLVRIPVRSIRTQILIYRELGVYLGQGLHRPCDDL